MDYDFINNELKKQAENLEIPDSLKPEHMKITLVEELKKETPCGDNHMADESIIKESSEKKRFWKFKPSLAVVIAALIIVAILPRLIPISNTGLETTNTNDSEEADSILDAANEASAIENSPIPIASSYKSIYKALSSYQKNLERQYGTVLTDGAMETAADLAGTVTEQLENSSTSSGTGSDDFSQTNIQVEGVDEGDIVKTDGNYFYILDSNNQCLQILKVDGETITPASTINLEEMQGSNENRHYYFSEFYLEDDYLVLISSNYGIMACMDSSSTSLAYESDSTVITIYDISDRNQPVIANTLKQDGSYRSSRKANGILYMFSYYNAYLEEGSDKPEYYIPYADGRAIKENCIYLPEYVNSTGYLVITAVDIKKADSFQSEIAIIANPYDFYVSQNNIYVANSTDNGDSETEIMKFSYGDGSITPIATNVVPGYTNNSFSFDEYNGYLRVVTTVYHPIEEINPVAKPFEDSVSSSPATLQSNSLYVLDEKLNIVGRIEDLAKDEQIYSARFFGDTGYFVTFQRVDPLFSVDLSDPGNPRILGELKISGFSSYLHFYSENLLLGIGYEADTETGRTTGIKLSMFDISDPTDVKEIDKLVIPEADYSPGIYNHKAVLINPQKNIIGLMLNIGEKQRNQSYKYYADYRTFSYDGESGFKQEISCVSDDDYYAESRGVYIGDYLYVIGGTSYISIYNLTDNTLIAKWYGLE